jgi:hypothetical protein
MKPTEESQMSAAHKARFSFTKLIVGDEEKMATYYQDVYGLNVVTRVEGDSACGGERFREVLLAPGKAISDGSLVMFRFVDRPAPRDQESILGFVTEDLDALVARVIVHGGKPVAPIKAMPEHGIRVVFTCDPEGHLAENVQMVPA